MRKKTLHEEELLEQGDSEKRRLSEGEDSPERRLSKKEDSPVRHPGGYHNSAIQVGCSELYEVKSEDGSNPFLECSLEIANLPPVDLYDPAAVRERIMDYYRIHAKYGIEPTVVALAMCLGIDRRRLYEIATDSGSSSRHRLGERLPRESRDLVKRAYQIKENMWEQWMRTIRGNPAAAIFLGKNHYGYEDRTEYVLTPNQSDSDYSRAEIMERLGLPSDSEDERLSDSDE